MLQKNPNKLLANPIYNLLYEYIDIYIYIYSIYVTLKGIQMSILIHLSKDCNMFI